VRLTADEIEYLSRKIVKTLVASHKIEVDSEPPLVEALIRAINEEMSLEEKLNEEARQVLMEHSSEMERSNITYTEMFKKVKRELAKKKGIVL
jgi:hypothetical protein